MHVELSPDKTSKSKVALVQEEVRRRVEMMKYDFKGIWPESKISST